MNLKAKHVAEEELKDIVRKEYSRLDKSNPREISSGDVAERSYNSIDPKTIAPILVQAAAFLKLAQLADNLRKKRRPPDTDQAELFEGLYKRYPVKRRGQLVDVLRDDLTLEERRRIENAMEAQINADTKHLKRFKAETERMIREGRFHKRA